MSRSTKEILVEVKKMIPPLLEKFHKGQMGRVAVIGGSEDYTGAPYFSAMASARLGADMSHVICTPTAAAVIKTYTPNLMVHPLLRESAHALPHETAAHVAATITALLPRLHVLVIGPGLGRDALAHDTCARILAAARARHLPVVLDADALGLVAAQPRLVQGYAECVLTPNVAEFARLCASAGVAVGGEGEEGEACRRLAAAWGGVLVVRKGRRDHISDGARVLVSDGAGGAKRSGGQGDTLTGAVATFLAWRAAYLAGLWDTEGALDGAELLALAAFGGSAVTRECSRLAFAKKGRSLQASDLTEEVFEAYQNLFEGAEAKC